ncbi:10373_t:CDS:1 [Cetraspora pellucida]|uniref:10373_t:CDS:1 n=1 Tax=Cetraspora pellucida TaxID=1433469 RepID=A0ACA9K2R0_9GLOM|nr:10373_t:CDS:1 [Cetraspora pellucida]
MGIYFSHIFTIEEFVNQHSTEFFGFNIIMFVISFMHPFCGVACARVFNATFSDSRPGRNYRAFSTSYRTCKIKECDKPCFIEPSGTSHPYCSRTCARKDLTRNDTKNDTQSYTGNNLTWNNKKETQGYTGLEKELLGIGNYH